MQLELADRGKRKRTYVQGYNRHANYVPGYSRRKPHLNDSSLFSFKLGDNGAIFLVVPDPDNRQAPREVDVAFFDSLPDSEFMKLINYVRDFNSDDVIDEAIQYRLSSPLSALATKINFQNAEEAVNVVHQPDVIVDPVEVSWWDKESLIPGFKNKVTVPVGAGVLYLILKKK